ncbi:hypothetical protein FRB90_008074 [Tulasnella sp. 427]|nr:hypothetical protein FRB90_008074 [Tulasnella sp. 427]
MADGVPPSPPPPMPTSTNGGTASPVMSVRSNPFSDPYKNISEAFLRSPVSPTSAPLPPSRPESAVSPTTPTMSISGQAEGGGRLLTPNRSDYAPMPPVPMDLDPPSRSRHVPHESMASFISATSRADSIINNGFVFFPPTPGSAQTAFSGGGGGAPTRPERPDDMMVPPRRFLAGFSTVSTASNMSNGLEAFPFHFGPGGGNAGVGGSGTGGMSQSMSMSTLANGTDVPSRAVPFGNDAGARASLDTLALSRDVEAYPLGFDRR